MAFDPQELLSTREKIATRLGEQAGFDPQLLLKPQKETVSEAAGEILGNRFDPEGSATPRIRMSLSRGDTIDEKNKRIKQFFPEGEVRVLPKSPVLGLEEDVLVFRESPEQSFKLVEPEGTDLTDVGEAIAPSAEAIIGESLALIGSRGASIPGLVSRMAGGAAAGEGVEQGVQSATGRQDQSPQQIAGEMATEGGLSAVGGFAASPVVAAGNVLRGRGATRVGPEGMETIRAADRLDPELARGLTPGLITDNPALQLSERQSAALLPGLQRRYRELTQRLDNAVRSGIDTDTLKAVVGRTQRALKDLSDTFLNQVRKEDSPMSAGGEALRKGIREYDEGTRQINNRLYEAARQVEEPKFDLSSLETLAGDLRAGAKGKIDPRVSALFDQIEEISGPITTPSGRVISVTDQLRNVRTQAFAIKNVPPGEVADQATGQANDLFKSINNVLDSPTNANPRFKELWEQANASAGERFRTMEKAAVIQSVKSENPAELVGKFARPGQVGNLKTLRDTVSKKRWDEFRNSAYSDLLSNPSQLSSKLKAFDQETLDVLMPRADQKAWRKVAQEMDRIHAVGADDLAERQISNVNFVDSLLSGADPRDAQTLIRAFNSGDKAGRDSIRAAIIDWTWKDIVGKTPRGLKVDRSALKSRIKTLKRNDMWRLVPKKMRDVLGDAETVSRAFERVIDAGTSIQAAEAVKGMGRLEAGAIRSFIQAGVISHFYLSDVGRRILIGKGLPNSRGEALRLIGAALAQTAPPEDISSLEGQLDPETVRKE